MHRQPGVGGPHSSTGTILRRGGRQILPGAGVHYSGQPASPHCMTLRGRTAWHTPRARGLAGGREGAPSPKLGINARTRHKRHFPASAGAPRTKSLRDFPRGVCGARSVHGNAQALRAWSVGRAHKRSAPGQSTRGFVHGPFRARPKARRAWSVHGGDRALHQYFKGGGFPDIFFRPRCRAATTPRDERLRGFRTRHAMAPSRAEIEGFEFMCHSSTPRYSWAFERR